MNLERIKNINYVCLFFAMISPVIMYGIYYICWPKDAIFVYISCTTWFFAGLINSMVVIKTLRLGVP